MSDIKNDKKINDDEFNKTCEQYFAYFGIETVSDKEIQQKKNVRKYINQNKFHKLERKDLEDELKRLDEKHQRYLKCLNENTERTFARINQIKEYLKK